MKTTDTIAGLRAQNISCSDGAPKVEGSLQGMGKSGAPKPERRKGSPSEDQVKAEFAAEVQRKLRQTIEANARSAADHLASATIGKPARVKPNENIYLDSRKEG